MRLCGFSDCARSPKDKRSRESRDSEHRTNHDRSSDEKLLLKMTSQNSSRDRKPLHNCTEKLREVSSPAFFLQRRLSKAALR